MNYVVFFLTALIPLVIGAVWYNPKVFLKPWLRASGLKQEDLSQGNMGLVFLFAYIFGCMLTTVIITLVIHQLSLFSVLANEPGVKDPNSEIGRYIADFMGRYGHNFRTFKHGALHGTIGALFFAMPVIGTNALFEKRRFAYIAIHTGYWIVTLALMGGVICQFLKPY